MNSLQSYESITEYNKTQLIQLAQSQADEILLAGSAEQAWAFLSKIELLISETKERIIEQTKYEVKKGHNFAFGVKMELLRRNTSSYKNSQKWVKLEKERKDLEKFLKSLKEPITVLDESTGEIITHYPPAIVESDYIKNSF